MQSRQDPRHPQGYVQYTPIAGSVNHLLDTFEKMSSNAARQYGTTFHGIPFTLCMVKAVLLCPSVTQTKVVLKQSLIRI